MADGLGGKLARDVRSVLDAALLADWTFGLAGAVAADPLREFTRDAVSVMRWIPVAERAAIRARASAYDCTAAFVAGLAATPALCVPPGRYTVGAGGAEIPIPSDRSIYGVGRGSLIRGASNFSTSYASDAAAKALFRTTGAENIELRGLSFRQFATGTAQAKLRFDDCENVRLVDIDTANTLTWDVLFLDCTDFEVLQSRFISGTGGNLGVGLRIAGRCRKFAVRGCDFSGALVTKPQEGLGATPSGDLWGSVGLNIDCADSGHVFSDLEQFKGGKGKLITLGAGAPQTVAIPGINDADWKAWVRQAFDPATTSGTSERRATVAITDDTLTFTGLPGGPALTYDYYYAYFGKTPRDGLVTDCRFDGFAYAALSIINGLDVIARDNFYSRCGDLGFDPEGCMGVSSINDTYVDCNSGGICAGWGSRLTGARFTSGSDPAAAYTYGISGGGASAGYYQAFLNDRGRDFANEPFEEGSMTVGAPSGSLQTCTGVGGGAARFTHVFVGEWVRIVHTGAHHEYQVTAKASNNEVTIDNSKRRLYDAPEVPLSALAVPAATYGGDAWHKSPYIGDAYGLTGNCHIAEVVFDDLPQAGTGARLIRSNLLTGLTIDGVSAQGRVPDIAIEVSQCQMLTLALGPVSGCVYVKNVTGAAFPQTYLSRSTQRGMILDAVRDAIFGEFLAERMDVLGNTSTPALIYGNCDALMLPRGLMVLRHGDAGNGQPYAQEGIWAGPDVNTVNTATPNNSRIVPGALYGVKSGVSLPIPALAANAATPDVRGSDKWVTANSSATIIVALAGLADGQTVMIFVGDANTSVDFTGTAMKGNAGVDWSPANGDFMQCTRRGSNFYCSVHDAT